MFQRLVEVTHADIIYAVNKLTPDQAVAYFGNNWRNILESKKIYIRPLDKNGFIPLEVWKS